MKTNCSIPASRASSTAYWITGLSTTGSISLGTALVAGRNRVPIPATGKTALRTGRGLVIGSERRILQALDSVQSWHNHGPIVHTSTRERRARYADSIDRRGGLYWKPRHGSAARPRARGGSRRQF